MKKRFAAVFAATAVLGVTTAFAANPFSDVTPQDWAYQAVSQLAAQGVINGYPDGTFKGQNNITRYEMAQMVAKAIARQDRVDAEQNAMINRLANEFSAELNNLGVRVGKLEDQVGNFKFTGDARLRYQGYSKSFATNSVDKTTGKATAGDNQKKSTFDYRARVKFEAQVNDNTKATIRLTSNTREFGDASASDGASIDRAYVTHNFGKNVSASVGRQDLTLGQGLTYDDTFDGAVANFGTDKLNATVAYGYAMAGGLNYIVGKTNSTEAAQYSSDIDMSQRDNPQLAVFQVNGKLGDRTNLSAFYTKVNGQEIEADSTGVKSGDKFHKGDNLDFYGVGASFQLADKLTAAGEWARFKDIDHSNAWVAGLTYGNYDIEKAGTFNVTGQYFSEDRYAPVVSSTWNQPFNQNYKAWMATVDYAVAKNVGLSAYATINAKDKDGNDAPEYYRAELNYKF